MKKKTTERATDVMKAAEVLSKLEVGDLSTFQQRVSNMTPAELAEITQHIDVLRRVVKNWQNVDVTPDDKPRVYDGE